jgi:hypothetical protein
MLPLTRIFGYPHSIANFILCVILSKSVTAFSAAQALLLPQVVPVRHA